MPKFSVKKPYTILVCVILVLVLGVVSIMKMTTDLLPNLSLPYLIVISTYPGASPEKVESDLTKPLEDSLGTVNGVKNVTSTSSENYCMVMLEFEDDTNMDSAMVKTSTALNQLADTLPDGASTPTLMEVSMDMMATEYVAVSMDGMDIFDLSDYVENEIIPEISRVDGVASIDTIGTVEQTVQVELNQNKIDEVNDKLLVKVSDKLADAKKELDDAKKELADGKAELNTAEGELNDAQAQLDEQSANIAEQLKGLIDTYNALIPEAEKKVSDLEDTINGIKEKINGITISFNDLNAVLAQLLGTEHHAEQLPKDIWDAVNSEEKTNALLAEMNSADTVLKGQILNQIDVVNADIRALTQAELLTDEEAAQLTDLLQKLTEDDPDYAAILQQLKTLAAAVESRVSEETAQDAKQAAAAIRQLISLVESKTVLQAAAAGIAQINTYRTELKKQKMHLIRQKTACNP